MNTKNIIELEKAFKDVVANWKGNAFCGIDKGYINREDGYPWFEVGGAFDKKSAQKFIQELANKMDVRVIFTRLTFYAQDDSSVVCGIFDINPNTAEGAILPNFANEPSRLEEMNKLGKEFLPEIKNNKKKESVPVVTAINTKTFNEMEKAFRSVVKKWGVKVFEGMGNGRVKLEDGLPWLEVNGKFTDKTAKQFIQELADALNIRMLYNRMESYSDGKKSVFGVFDFDPDKHKELGNDVALPAYSDNEDAREFMEDYGTEIFPQGYKKPK